MKEKEARRKMMQNQKYGVDNDREKGKEMMQNERSGVDGDGQKGKDHCGYVEKIVPDKEQQKETNEEAAKPRVTTYNIDDNAGISVSFGPKSVQESENEPAKEDFGASHNEQNDIVQGLSQAKRQKLANGYVGISDQQKDVAQEKRQKSYSKLLPTLKLSRNSAHLLHMPKDNEVQFMRSQLNTVE
ncbi:hypothetical protein HAX54_001234 [Datura stramonium]|uniref:Uncharacterized protein n=1 Tax=Datura stramonium TaxID=4076 RepID=A0ABS8T2T6_DATST|nr:hypothetical protein [Datura stramonium]